MIHLIERYVLRIRVYSTDLKRNETANFIHKKPSLVYKVYSYQFYYGNNTRNMQVYVKEHNC